MKKYIISAILLFSIALFSHAQTGTWSGKLDVQGTKLSLVFHLDGDNPTMDSPDQGVKGIPIEVARTATGSIIIKAPSIGATYEGSIGRRPLKSLSLMLRRRSLSPMETLC